MTAAAFRIERRDGGLLAHVDLRHDFYFDHPLGHLPGLLLLDIALAAVTGTRAAPPWFAQFDIAFRALAALHRPLEIELAAVAERTTRCTLSQGGRSCAEAQVTEGEGEEAMPAAEPMPAEAAFASLDPGSVRKARPENVFLGQAGAGAAIQLPHRLAAALPASERGRYTPVYLTECFLQLCRRGRGEADGDTGRIPPSREILTLVGARLPQPVADDERLAIEFRPGAAASPLASHPLAKRRTATLLNRDHPVGQFFCDVVEL